MDTREWGFIIRNRSYRACAIRTYKSCSTASANPCWETINHPPGQYSRFEHLRPFHTRSTHTLLIIYHFFLSFLLNDKFNSLLEYDCSSFCYCGVLLWASSRSSVFWSESDRNDRENWISILDLLSEVINLLASILGCWIFFTTLIQRNRMFHFFTSFLMYLYMRTFHHLLDKPLFKIFTI